MENALLEMIICIMGLFGTPAETLEHRYTSVNHPRSQAAATRPLRSRRRFRISSFGFGI